MESIGISEAISFTLGPYPVVNIATRWHEIMSEIELLEQPSAIQLNAPEVREIQRRIEIVFIGLWQLRELSKEAGLLSMDAAIDQSQRMSLAHDLGNLVKHRVLTHPPRSHFRPVFGDLTLQREGDSPWRVQWPVSHGADRYEAVEIARGAAEDWRLFLEGPDGLSQPI
ncbi:hypothetical protein [Kribbella speibonae]|uniref:HD domain-containing protein n=1 Tax=Kribbella speibonae TaxID=1572660 RepID=A0ABY1ZSI0_9ACTN|nr:hypothetical protein [Kribbella speibonae]TCC16471.1 hypothetical protein E0H58_38990 [Kribbella speibonae]